MKTLLLRLALVSALAFAAFSAIAPAAADDEGAPSVTQAGGNGTDILPGTLWSLAGVAVGAAVMGTLYLLKRRVGGFPAHPSWTAPISVMRSRDLPGDDGADGHGASPDGHGTGHAPAH